MFAADEENNDSIKPTKFDLEKLDCLQVGDYFDGETGGFRILRYKDDYNVMLFNSTTKKEFTTHLTKESIINFLNN